MQQMQSWGFPSQMIGFQKTDKRKPDGKVTGESASHICVIVEVTKLH